MPSPTSVLLHAALSVAPVNPVSGAPGGRLGDTPGASFAGALRQAQAQEHSVPPRQLPQPQPPQPSRTAHAQQAGQAKDAQRQSASNHEGRHRQAEASQAAQRRAEERSRERMRQEQASSAAPRSPAKPATEPGEGSERSESSERSERKARTSQEADSAALATATRPEGADAVGATEGPGGGRFAAAQASTTSAGAMVGDATGIAQGSIAQDGGHDGAPSADRVDAKAGPGRGAARGAAAAQAMSASAGTGRAAGRAAEAASMTADAASTAMANTAATQESDGARASGMAPAAAPSSATAALAGTAGAAHSFTPGATAAADAAPAVPFEAQLSAALGSAEFAPALGVQLTLLAREGVQEARLHLNPAEMGPIAVRIALDGAQAEVHFQADLAATREALQASLPELAAVLLEGGFTLSGGGVSDGSMQHRDGGPAPEAAAGRTGSPAGHFGNAEPVASVAEAPMGRAQGLVDLYA